MNCPNCKTINESGNIFCVDCGTTLTPTGSASRINVESGAPHVSHELDHSFSPSIETSVFSVDSGSSRPPVIYTPPHSIDMRVHRNNNKALWFVIAGLIVLILAGGGYFLFNIQKAAAEV